MPDQSSELEACPKCYDADFVQEQGCLICGWALSDQLGWQYEAALEIYKLNDSIKYAQGHSVQELAEIISRHFPAPAISVEGVASGPDYELGIAHGRIREQQAHDDICLGDMITEAKAGRWPRSVEQTCWHCLTVLAGPPLRPRCEQCPDECDVENCDAPGCVHALRQREGK